jgi:serine/threonine protein kinase
MSSLRSALEDLVSLLDNDKLASIDKIASTIEREFNVDLNNFIGHGDMGYAWLLSGGFVFKLTIDNNEANAAASLISKRHPNVAAYYRVYKIGDLDLFVILQEYGGKPLTDPDLKRTLDALPNDTDEIVSQLKAHYDKTKNNAFKQLLDGMQWIRDEGVGYFDLHSDNVVQSNGIYKIIDVGGGDVEKHKLSVIKLENRLDSAFSHIDIIGL